MKDVKPKPPLALRMGLSQHASPLRFYIRELFDRCGEELMPAILLSIANARGFRVITDPRVQALGFEDPGLEKLSNEALVCAILQPNSADHPQLLRCAAQCISRGKIDLEQLLMICRRERAIRVLAELARQALRVDPDHATWRAIGVSTAEEAELRSPLIHWTRLAEPTMEHGKVGAQGWELVS